ncbi:DUF3987 domain-containing protein [Roseomonas sp. BN140053]|uniref:DUF3987 domain-containing protein n=1 Tax=Roseomonas sp. BN140053 TaxID=3391898 RepID=UPI0039ED2958
MTGRDDLSTAIRLRVLENGYTPIPITAPDYQHPKVRSPGKQPFFQKWTEVSRETVTPEVVRAWPRVIHNHPNTGLLCGEMIGVDIDALVPALSAELQALAVGMLGTTPMRRIGKAPKALFAYRVAAPMTKKETPELVLPDGTVAQVEVLAKGQQFVAYGVHPDTGLEYEWPNTGPDVLPLRDLPVTDEERIGTFLIAAEAVIRRAGGRTRKEIEAAQAPAQPAAAPRPATIGNSRPGGSGNEFFLAVNARAAADIGRWMTAIFGAKAREQAGTGAWRVSSADLNRGLEEDLSYHPTEGGMDWGTRESCSPIDIAMQHGGAPDPAAAALWLCEQLGVAPESLGWRGRQGSRPAPGAEEAEEAEEGFTAPPPGEEQAGRVQGRRPAAGSGPSWQAPIDFLAEDEITGPPHLRQEHIPAALWGFVKDTAERMGVDPASVALVAIVTCSAAVTDDWEVQPKRHDTQWTEQPRLWGGIVGSPSVLKTPVLRACTGPLDKAEMLAREIFEGAMARYKADHKAWKDAKGETVDEPKRPRATRWVVEGTTVEALSEVLRTDGEAKYAAPAKKVLVRADELAELIGSFDKYKGGGSGSSDRGAYLRLYNGGRYNIDRVMRGSFPIPNWSACIVGGIQPDLFRSVVKEAKEDGLMQRFMFCVPGDTGTGVDRVPDAGALQRYAELIKALTALTPARTQLGSVTGPVVLHGDAHQHREGFNDLTRALSGMPDTPGRLVAAYGKWTGLWARLALTFHLIEAADVIARTGERPPMQVLSEATARMASNYMEDILLPHLLRADALLYVTEQSGHAHWIAKFIMAQGKPRVTARDVVRAYGALRAPEQRRELGEVMTGLVTFGWLLPEHPDLPAREETAWLVNPMVLERFAARGAAERERRQRTREEMGELIRKRQEKRR